MGLRPLLINQQIQLFQLVKLRRQLIIQQQALPLLLTHRQRLPQHIQLHGKRQKVQLPHLIQVQLLPQLIIHKLQLLQLM